MERAELDRRRSRGPIFEFLDAEADPRALPEAPAPPGALFTLARAGVLILGVPASSGALAGAPGPAGAAIPAAPLGAPEVAPEFEKPLSFWPAAEKLPCPATQLEPPPDPAVRAGDLPAEEVELDLEVGELEAIGVCAAHKPMAPMNRRVVMAAISLR